MIAQNQFAASVPATIRLRWKGAIAKEEFEIKPKLYVLAVGVSAYQDAALRLDLAAKDPLDFGAAWNAQKGGLYSGVEPRVLTDAQATKGGHPGRFGVAAATADCKGHWRFVFRRPRARSMPWRTKSGAMVLSSKAWCKA